MYHMFYVFTLICHIAAAPYPAHIDLQELGDIIYTNGKYKVYKPTTHKITEYEYYKNRLGGSNIRRNGERVFVDKNGLRHFWSSFGEKTRSHRKSDINLYELTKNSLLPIDDDTESHENGTVVQIIRQSKNKASNNKNVTTKKPAQNATTKKIAATTKKNAATTKNVTTKKNAVTTKKNVATTKKNAATIKKSAATTKKNVATTKKNAATTKPPIATTKGKPVAKASTKPVVATTKGKAAPKATTKPVVATTKGKAAPKATPKPVVATTKSAPDANKPTEKGKSTGPKNVAITSFFCPFLGVIKMMTVLD